MPREVSLIPGELRDAAVAPAWVFGIAIVGLCGAFALVAIPAMVLRSRVADARAEAVWIEARHVDAQQRAAGAERELASYRRIVRQATALRALLAQHRTWAPFFQLLEERTLPTIRYESVTADVTGDVFIPVTAPSVRAASEQIAAWQETGGVASLEVNGLANTADELGVIRGTRFDLRFTVDPVFFAAPAPPPVSP